MASEEAPVEFVHVQKKAKHGTKKEETTLVAQKRHEQTTLGEEQKQEQGQKEVKIQAKEDRRKTKEDVRQEIEELKANGKRREARYLRADLIGFPYEQGELDSDEHSSVRLEFDCASDSSLVPPWEMDSSD